MWDASREGLPINSLSNGCIPTLLNLLLSLDEFLEKKARRISRRAYILARLGQVRGFRQNCDRDVSIPGGGPFPVAALGAFRDLSTG